MAHAQSNRMQHSDAGLSCLLRLLRLFCLLAWLTACTVQDGVTQRTDYDSAGLASEAPPGAVAPPSTIRPSGSAWSGMGGLLGNLGNLVGSTGSGGTLTSGNETAPAGAMHVTVYYATDRQYQARSHNYGCSPTVRRPTSATAASS